MRLNVKINTAGDGYWSRHSTRVSVKRIDVPYINDEGDFGELRVYFDTATWDVNKKGLIYTDTEFLQGLKDALAHSGLNPVGVDYSEQGMQGYDYVSLDVGKEFLDSWQKLVDKMTA